MERSTTMTLSLELDMRTALRVARFEVETGIGLAELLVRAVEAWETEHRREPPGRLDNQIPVHFEYSPRGRPSRFRIQGLYSPDSTEVEITATPEEIRHLTGERGAPSATAIQVVEALNPEITPNRNGWRDWRVVATGQPIGQLRRKHH